MAANTPSSANGGSGADGNENIHLQVVHTPGITRVLYAPKEADIDRLFTGGDDYLVRLLPSAYASTQDPLLIEDSTAPVTWLDAGRRVLVVASEDGTVRLYKHRPESDESQVSPMPLAGVLARTSLPTRCVALEKALPPGRSPRAAICSDELLVKLVDVEDTRRVNLLTGHSRAVRSASWSPRDSLLVTSSCDGTARVWDCSTAEPGCTKVLDGLPSTRPEDETSIHAEWHPSGEFFVLPSKGNELVIYSTSSGQGWSKTGVFTPPARGTSVVNPPTGALTAASFCPNGRFLAAATTDGQVTIWETSTRQPVRARKADSNVTGLSWNPSADALAWVDTSGQLVRWDNVMGPNYPSPHEPVAFGAAASAQNSRLTRSAVDDLFAGTGLDDDDEEEGDVDDDNGDGGAGAARFLDKEAADGRGGRRDRGEDLDGDGADGLEDFLVDDDGGEYSAALAAERKQKKRAARSSSRPGAMVALSKTQGPFQPNSTPMRNSRRYLSLSLFGSLISIDQDTHHVVSFESFDSAARRNWKMVDHFGYTMASVGATGALLACPRKGESASAVHFKPFEAAGAWSVPGAEWGVELPKGEEIVAIAMGGAPARRPSEDDDDITKAASSLTSTAILATSTGYLRFFSSSGLQRYLWALGSQIVTMAAGKQHTIVVHRTQAAVDGFQNLSYTLIDLISMELKQSGLLPLGKNVELQWIGFNELDVAGLYDSRGVLYLLDRAYAAPGQARWVPVLDTTTLATSSAGEEGEEGATGAVTSRMHFWPLSMSASQLFCVFVRGAVPFPDPSANGHPLIQEVGLKLPVLGLGQPNGDLEEKHLRQSLLASSIRSALGTLVVPPTEYSSDIPDPNALVHESDKDLLQLIQLSCKSDKHAKALDAARELHGARMLDAALQIAAFFHLPSLADRMESLRDWVETRAERDERLERDGPAGAPAEDFSEAASRSRSSRILAPSSQTPQPQIGAGSTSAFARKALTEDFNLPAVTPRRSQQFRGSARFDALDASPAPSVSASDAAMPPPALPRGPQADSTYADMDEDERSSPGASVRKRKCVGGERSQSLLDDGEDDADEGLTTGRLAALSRPPHRAASGSETSSTSAGASSNPFNKTSLNLGGAGAAPTHRNPFARQRTQGSAARGMERDRSMHKSNSFFDRAEADLTSGSLNASSANDGGRAAKKTKQSTLFGLGSGSGSGASSDKGKGKGRAGTGAGRPMPAVSTPAFGETQVEDDSQMEFNDGDGDGGEESIRATLEGAAERESRRERRGGLEETQLVDEDEETQQEQEQEDAGMVDGEEAGEGAAEGEDGEAGGAGNSGRSKLEAFRRSVASAA